MYHLEIPRGISVDFSGRFSLEASQLDSLLMQLRPFSGLESTLLSFVYGRVAKTSERGEEQEKTLQGSYLSFIRIEPHCSFGALIIFQLQQKMEMQANLIHQIHSSVIWLPFF